MVRIARSEVFNPHEIGVYHTFNRTVRKHHLHGIDKETGRDYSYRREWFRQRMEFLATHFCIDVMAYAIMSNHWHAVLRNRPDLVAQLSDRQVAIRWLKITSRSKREKSQTQFREAEIAAIVHDAERVKELRERLSHISWFIRLMCQTIARRCNLEDEVEGHFFEDRYKLHRLDNDADVLAAMAYVDLNPLRAFMADALDDFAEVSIHDRLRTLEDEKVDLASWLAPLEQASEVDGQPVDVANERRGAQTCKDVESLRDQLGCIPMRLEDYKKLLWRLAVESRPELQAYDALTKEIFQGSLPLGDSTINIADVVARQPPFHHCGGIAAGSQTGEEHGSRAKSPPPSSPIPAAPLPASV